MKTLIITTGGTISSRKNADGVFEADEGVIRGMLTTPSAYGVHPSPEGNFQIVAPFCILSENFAEEHFLVLKSVIEKGITDGYEKFIITHGSDSLMFTAWFLRLVFGPPAASGSPPYFRGEYPCIVLVAANKSPEEEGSDAPENLKRAFQIKERGVWVSYGVIDPPPQAALPPMDRGELAEPFKKVLFLKAAPNFFVNSAGGAEVILVEPFHSGTVPAGVLEFAKAHPETDVAVAPASKRLYKGMDELFGLKNVFPLFETPVELAYILCLTDLYKKFT